MPTSPTCRKRAHTDEPCGVLGAAGAGDRSLSTAAGAAQQAGADRRACCCCRYRNLALKWHPLRCDEADAQSNFDEVSEAFEVLSDCESRLPPR